MKTKRNIWLWVSYDFANSIVFIVFFLYFAQHIVVDRGVSDLHFNLTFTIAAFLLLLTVPITGFLLDKHGHRLPGLRICSVTSLILFASTGLSAVYEYDMLSLIFFALALYTYLLTFTFYTPLFNDITTEKSRGKVSGYGITANYIGQLTGLIIVLPFANGYISIFGASVRAETLIPATILCLLLSLPMLIWFKEDRREKVPFSLNLKELFRETKALFLFPSVGIFMLSYFFFNDAVLTASNNFSIFLEQVWSVSDTAKTFILLGILVTSAIGGLASGHVADRLGHKRTLVVIISGWIILLPAVGFAPSYPLFVTLSTLMGFWFGATWAISRSVMSYLAPLGKHNIAFGYFGLMERASAFIGPVVWGMTVTGLSHVGTDRYRYATLVVTGFIVLGLLCLVRIRSDREKVV